MKKIIMLLVAVMLVVSFSGQAMAAFNNGDLIRVVYQDTATGTKEIATDLGIATSLGLTTPIANNINFASNPTDYSSFGTSMNNLYVAYYVNISGSATGPTAKAWLSGVSSIGAAAASGYATNGGSISTYYKSLSSTAAQVTANNTNGGSFLQLMEIGQPGRGSFTAMQPYGGGTMNLGGFGSNGYVDQGLFYYAKPNTASSGVLIGTMRTFANGTSELMASSVPVPAAIYLFGSGLLGLAGLRRKVSA